MTNHEIKIVRFVFFFCFFFFCYISSTSYSLRAAIKKKMVKRFQASSSSSSSSALPHHHVFAIFAGWLAGWHIITIIQFNIFFSCLRNEIKFSLSLWHHLHARYCCICCILEIVFSFFFLNKIYGFILVWLLFIKKNFPFFCALHCCNHLPLWFLSIFFFIHFFCCFSV